jgi:hypothetical protein
VSILVVDILDKKLRVDTNYYIIPVILISRGGASLGLKNTGQSSPLDIVVVNRYQGLPLIFTPVNPKKDVIRVSTDLNIKFSSHGTISDRFTGWETINNWFKIEKYGDAYKLVYCPSVVHKYRFTGLLV